MVAQIQTWIPIITIQQNCLVHTITFSNTKKLWIQIRYTNEIWCGHNNFFLSLKKKRKFHLLNPLTPSLSQSPTKFHSPSLSIKISPSTRSLTHSLTLCLSPKIAHKEEWETTLCFDSLLFFLTLECTPSNI